MVSVSRTDSNSNEMMRKLHSKLDAPSRKSCRGRLSAIYSETRYWVMLAMLCAALVASCSAGASASAAATSTATDFSDTTQVNVLRVPFASPSAFRC